jgi:F0F1-type ATP synthase delta subunit
MLSRTAVANYAAEVLITGDNKQRQDLILHMAAWLKNSGRTRQAKYLVADIAKQLSDKGYSLIAITTSRQISDDARQAILDYLKTIFGTGNKFELVEIIDNNVIGGVLIDTPNGILDLTVKNKLMTLIKGASV